MRAHRRGLTVLVAFSLAIVGGVTLGPATATAESTPAPSPAPTSSPSVPVPTPTSVISESTAPVPTTTTATTSGSSALDRSVGTTSADTSTSTANVLTAISLVRPAAYLGERATAAYTVRDDVAPALVQFSYTTASGEPATIAQSVDPATSGQVVVTPAVIGPHTLTKVLVVDEDQRGYTFNRDGTWAAAGANGVHDLDFSALDFTVLPNTPSARVRPLPHGASLTIEAGEQVRAGLTGYRVTVEPGGKVVSLPVGTTEFATHSIAGLPNGSARQVSVTPLSPWGDGRTFTTTVTAMMSTNVFSPGDLTGDRRADVVAHLQRGLVTSEQMLIQPVYVYPGTGAGGFGRKYIANSWEYLERIVPGGDSNSDGRADWFGEDNGALNRYNPNGSAVRIGVGWSTMRFIDGGVDFSGDGRTDIIGVSSGGDMFLYRMDGSDRITSKTKIGAGWLAMVAVFSPGDFNGDRKADIVAVDSLGDMWLYRGNGLGGFLGTRTRIGKGWAGFGAVQPLRDFNGDGRMDIGAVTMSGDLLLYGGNGVGGFITPRKIGVGWHSFF